MILWVPTYATCSCLVQSRLLWRAPHNIQQFFLHPDCSVGCVKTYSSWGIDIQLYHWHLVSFPGFHPWAKAASKVVDQVEARIKAEWLTCDLGLKMGCCHRKWPLDRENEWKWWLTNGSEAPYFQTNPFIYNGDFGDLWAFSKRICLHRKPPGSSWHLPSGGALWCGAPVGPRWTRGLFWCHILIHVL